MPVTPPPKPIKKPQPTEAEIEAMINRGGAIATAETQTIVTDDPDKAKFFNLRLTVGIFKGIDRMREKRPRKPGSPKLGISTQDWLVEAVLEKLEREKRKYKD